MSVSIIIFLTAYSILMKFINRDIIIKAILSSVLLLVILLIVQLLTYGININNNTPVVVPNVVNTNSGSDIYDKMSDDIIKQHEALTNKSN